MVILTDVDYLGPDGCPLPMLLGRENQYQSAYKLLAQLPTQLLVFRGYAQLLPTNLLDTVKAIYTLGQKDVFMNLLVPMIWIKQLKSRQKLLLLLLLGFILSVSQASAYIDPGTASMVWQLMLAVVLASVYAVHTYWIRIKNAIMRRFNKKSDDNLNHSR